MKFDGFDWDLGNREKCQKHGVSIEEIETLFIDGVLVNDDVCHSNTERRFHASGTTAGQRHVFVVFA